MPRACVPVTGLCPRWVVYSPLRTSFPIGCSSFSWDVDSLSSLNFWQSFTQLSCHLHRMNTLPDGIEGLWFGLEQTFLALADTLHF